MHFREHGKVQIIGTLAIISGAFGLIGAGLAGMGRYSQGLYEGIMHYWYVPLALIAAGVVLVCAALWTADEE